MSTTTTNYLLRKNDVSDLVTPTTFPTDMGFNFDLIDSIMKANADAISGKQNTLVSGTNIKTINGTSIMGSGNINVSGSGGSIGIIDVTEYGAIGDGITNDTSAINLAIADLTPYSTLYFPKGTYLITPSISITVANVTIRGEGKIITNESSKYNFMIGLQADNITVKDLSFDNSGDSAFLPDASNGCHTLFFHQFQNATVDNCKFKGYGVTCVLTQPQDTFGYGTVKVTNCKLEWQRKYNGASYDVSHMNLDAYEVILLNNTAISTDSGLITDDIPQTAFELHSRKLTVMGNSVTRFKTAFLPYASLSLHTSYDDTPCSWNISNNKGYRLLNGISAWAGNVFAQAYIENFIIDNNVFNLHGLTDAINRPTMGIGFINGDTNGSKVRNGIISNNIIEYTYDSGVTIGGYMGGKPTSDIYGGVGAISFNTSNSCEDIEVYGNKVINFSGTAINLIARQDTGTNLHKRIKIHHNTFTNCDTSTYFDLLQKGIFVLKDCEDISIEDNELVRTTDITVATRAMIGLLTGISNIKYLRNNKKTYHDLDGFFYGVDAGAEIADVITDDETLLYYGATREKRIANYDITPTTQKTFNTNELVNDSGTIKACTVRGTVRTISAVTSAFLSARQVTCAPLGTLGLEDIVTFPNGEKVMVVSRDSLGYIYLASDVTTWTGSQSLTLTSPTFV